MNRFAPLNRWKVILRNINNGKYIYWHIVNCFDFNLKLFPANFLVLSVRENGPKTFSDRNMTECLWKDNSWLGKSRASAYTNVSVFSLAQRNEMDLNNLLTCLKIEIKKAEDVIFPPFDRHCKDFSQFVNIRKKIMTYFSTPFQTWKRKISS